MRKAILMMLLAGLSSGAAAEWVSVGGEGAIGTAYIDPATIRRAGNIVKMWDLIDYKTAKALQAGPYMSMKTQYEYDCKEESSRRLYATFHSGKMGGGEIVITLSDPSPWNPVSPGTVQAVLWKIACGEQSVDIDQSQGAKMNPSTTSVPKKTKPQASNAAPFQSKGASYSIPLRQRGGVFEVMATLNSEVKVFFVVDSGASDVTIPESVAGLLLDNGSLTKADFLGTKKYQFANGASGSGKVVRLRTLDLGGHLLKDVRAVVLAGDDVPVLLGQSALRQLGGWSINAKAQKLEVTP